MDETLRRRAQALQRPLSPLPRKPADAAMVPRCDADSHIEFTAMEVAYARHGGMLPANEVIERMRGQCEQPISVLAKWIVAGAMITVDWRFDILIPIFQIDPHLRGLRPGCREIVAELRHVMSDWEIARWFATSDPRLGGLAPIDMLAASWRDVFQAARATRSILRDSGAVKSRRMGPPPASPR